MTENTSPTPTSNGLASRDGLRMFAIPVVLAVLTLASYWPVLHNDFVRYGDPEYVTENARVLSGLTRQNIDWAFTTGLGGNWHPVAWLSHMLDVQLFGAIPGNHHLTSLMLHVANTLLLFLLLKQITLSQWRSAFVAALFALHPLHVESVAWIAERKDVLSTFFFMLTLLAYARFAALKTAVTLPNPGQTTKESPSKFVEQLQALTRNAGFFFGLTLFLFALGLMSKPMLVTLPFVLLLLDYWPLGRATNWKDFRPVVIEKTPFFALTILCSIITFSVHGERHAVSLFFPFSRRVVNTIVSYWKYLGKTVWPVDLTVFYPHPDAAYPVSDQWPLWLVLPAALGLLAVSALAFLKLKRAPWFGIGWFWYLGTLLPVIGLVQVGSQAMADRYTYIPLIGIFVIVAWGGSQLFDGKRFAAVGLPILAGIAILGAAILTRAQLAHWNNTVTLFTHALEVTRNNAVAHCHIGMEFGRRGDYQQALEQFQLALQADPKSADGHYGLGYTFQNLGRMDEALREYQDALRLSPWHARAHRRTAEALWGRGDFERALDHYRRAVELNPEDAGLRLQFARALLERGEGDRASRQLELLVDSAPQFGDALQALAELCLKEGRIAEAEQRFRQLVRLHPASVEARVNLGGVLWQRGKRVEALEEYAEAVKLNPAHPVAQYNFGTALMSQGRSAEAASRFAEATRLKPDYIEALAALGHALSGLGRTGEAVGPFRAAANLAPANATLQVNAGTALMLAGQTNAATPFFARAHNLDPDLPHELVQAAQALAGEGRTRAAESRLKLALWIEPANAEVRESLSRLQAGAISNESRSGKPPQ